MANKNPTKPAQRRRQKLIFKQSDMERCIRAARAMGLSIGSVDVDPHTGKISIIPGTPKNGDHNEWDDDHGTAKAAVR